MAEIDCYEHQLFDASWLNGYSVPYYNTHINKYYAKSVCKHSANPVFFLSSLLSIFASLSYLLCKTCKTFRDAL